MPKMTSRVIRHVIPGIQKKKIKNPSKKKSHQNDLARHTPCDTSHPARRDGLGVHVASVGGLEHGGERSHDDT